jgi:serine/threonine protein phosphatase 1
MGKRFSEAVGENRYSLGKCVLSVKPMVFFGINPSTATAGRDDPTIRRIKTFAERYNHGSWIMLNIYPKIESHPNNLPVNMDKAIHKRNIDHIKKYIDDDSIIVAAWGDAIANKRHPYLKICLREIVNEIDGINKKWYSIGELTKKGNPWHPLWVSLDSELKKFDIGHYVGK